MASGKVVVLYGRSLMAQGLEALLRSFGSLDVVGIDLEQPDAWERLRSSRAQAVLVEPADLEHGQWSTLWRFLDDNQDLSIILVHTSDDSVSIYRKQRMAIRDPDDLVAAIGLRAAAAPS